MSDGEARGWWWLKGAGSGPRPHRAACCSPTCPGRREGGYGDEGLPCHAGTSSGPGDKKPGAVPDSGWFSVRQVISGPESPLHSEGRTFTALPMTCDKSEWVT